jgi:AcrR family transcriptional regulator
MGTSERRKREKEERRRAIMDAARELFWKRGYQATTMPQIAKRAELAPGTLYLYFPSKSALYAELLLDGYDILIPHLETCVQPGRSPREQAGALVDAFFEFAIDRPEYFNIIFFLIQTEGRGPRQEAVGGDLLMRLQAKEDECKKIAAVALGADSLEQIRSRIDAVWSMLAGPVFFFRGDGPEALARVAAEAKAVILAALFGDRT